MTDPTDEFQRLAREAFRKWKSLVPSPSNAFNAGADFGRELGKPEGFQMAVEMLRNEGRRGGACLAVSWADWLSERGPK